MKQNKMALLLAIVFVMISLFSFTTMASATEATQNFTTQGLSTTGTTTTVTENTTGSLDKLTITTDPNVNGGVSSVNLPNVQIDTAEKYVERKGFELVGLLQKFVQPFAIVVFIICAILAMLGSFGNSQLVGKGIWGMMIAVIMYAIVLSAPELLDFMNAWLKS